MTQTCAHTHTVILLSLHTNQALCCSPLPQLTPHTHAYMLTYNPRPLKSVHRFNTYFIGFPTQRQASTQLQWPRQDAQAQVCVHACGRDFLLYNSRCPVCVHEASTHASTVHSAFSPPQRHPHPHLHAHTHTRTHTRTHTHIRTHTHTYTHMYTYTCTHTYIHSPILLSTHTPTSPAAHMLWFVHPQTSHTNQPLFCSPLSPASSHTHVPADLSDLLLSTSLHSEQTHAHSHGPTNISAPLLPSHAHACAWTRTHTHIYILYIQRARPLRSSHCRLSLTTDSTHTHVLPSHSRTHAHTHTHTDPSGCAHTYTHIHTRTYTLHTKQKHS